MTDSKTTPQKKSKNNPLFWLIALIAVAVFYYFKNPDGFKDMLAGLPMFALNFGLVLLGFGGVIFIHELGHFVAAKSVGIMVEAFALGFGPTLLGVKKVGTGLQIRIFPTLFPGPDGQGMIRFVIPASVKKAGETEYQIRLIPLGGFVKMLGQEDIGADKPTDNPRAFVNKTVWQRLIVISAGVIMNIIGGIIVFIIVFSHGVDLPPAVVGTVIPNQPAAEAGMRPGDEILAINDKTDIGFMDVMLAGAFADIGEKVNFKVRHLDGSVETLSAEPEFPPSYDPDSAKSKKKKSGIKQFGIEPATTLTIFNVKEPVAIEKLTKVGLPPGGTITAVNGKTIERYDQLYDALHPAAGVIPAEKIVKLTTEVKNPDGTTKQTQGELTLSASPNVFIPLQYTGQVLSMVPRLKISPSEGSPAKQAGAEDGDIVLRFGTLNTPTITELKDYCKNFENKPVDLVVLRKENGVEVEKTLSVTPAIWPPKPLLKTLFNKIASAFKKELKPTPIIGVMVGYDWEHPVIAACKEFDENTKPLDLPRGSTITAVAGRPIANWDQIIARLAENKNKPVELEYLAPAVQTPVKITAAVPTTNNWIGFVYDAEIPIPLKPLKTLFRGDTWRHSLQMGLDKSWTFLAQTYLMIRGMVTGSVSASDAAVGPVGIMKISYTVVEDRSFAYYFYFFAMISICVAAFNFLPLPILDGGYVVLLLVEKFKGSPVSIKAQEIINYAGLLLIGSFFLYVTFNDIIKWATGAI